LRVAVSAKTVSDAAENVPKGPVRTCIGCRVRAAAAELLRVVAAPGRTATAVVPDPRHRAAGRGAWLHPRPDCVELAERRRAFGRALRVDGPIDTGDVKQYVAQLGTQTSGNPQE
jgi:predicted RNA-binding protein YlxR (DUF448 family)